MATVCDKCFKKISYGGDDVGSNFCHVLDYKCTPWEDSKHQSEKAIFVVLENGEYCTTCLDKVIDAREPTHLLPKFEVDFLKGLLTCPCKEHEALRNDGITLESLVPDYSSIQINTPKHLF